MLNSLQVLRALAALMVLVFHLGIFLDENRPDGFPVFMPGAAGVDLFFVVSGFIMMVSTPANETPLRFAARRTARIVPLYWLVTVMVCIFAAVRSWAFQESDFSPASILASLLFVPHLNLHGFIQPVLTDGWTLNHEMAFYALFAIALALPRSWRLAGVLTLLTLAWGIAALCKPGVAAQFYSDPIQFEFAGGCLIGRLVQTRFVADFARRTPMWPFALLAITIGGLAWWAVPGVHSLLRYGAPSALLVFAAACQDLYRKPTAPSLLTQLGDGSYSFYLLHRLAINSVGVIMLRVVGTSWFGVTAIFAAVITVTMIASLISLSAFERPANRFVRKLLMRDQPNRKSTQVDGGAAQG